MAICSLTSLQNPRFLIAGAITILALIIGFVHFGKIARAGIEAIGRNPMSADVIRFSIIFNLLMMLVLMAISLAIAYLILTI